MEANQESYDNENRQGTLDVLHTRVRTRLVVRDVYGVSVRE